MRVAQRVRHPPAPPFTHHSSDIVPWRIRAHLSIGNGTFPASPRTSQYDWLPEPWQRVPVALRSIRELFMNRRLLSAAVLVVSSLLSAEAAYAAPATLPLSLHAMFGKTRMIAFTLRNDSNAPLKVKGRRQRYDDRPRQDSQRQTSRRNQRDRGRCNYQPRRRQLDRSGHERPRRGNDRHQITLSPRGEDRGDRSSSVASAPCVRVPKFDRCKHTTLRSCYADAL